MIFLVAGGLAVGLSLGIFGSGGSILTVPVLVYLLGHAEKPAIAESLAIVGSIAFVGALPYARRGLVDWRNVLYFGAPGMLGTYGGAAVARWVPGGVQLAVFAGVMLLAARSMLRRPAPRPAGAPGAGPAAAHPAAAEAASAPRSRIRIGLDGLGVGLLTGFVGVGGGFLIVPALVLLGGLPMHVAVGTSLMIIALKSGVGFAEYLRALTAENVVVDVRTIVAFAALGVAGSWAGGWAGRRFRADQLRRGFAVALIVVGIAILVREVPPLLAGAP